MTYCATTASKKASGKPRCCTSITASASTWARPAHAPRAASVQQRRRTKRSLARLGLKGADSRHRVAGPGAARYSFRTYEWRGYVPTFKAIVIEKGDGGQKVRLTDFDEANLMGGDVTIPVQWSTANYKDGLALTGSRRSPRHLREALHTRRDQRQVQYRCVFLILGTTCQQPEGTLNTCLRKVRERFCAFPLLGHSRRCQQPHLSRGTAPHLAKRADFAG